MHSATAWRVGLLLTIAYLGSWTAPVYSQQNLFNVPSAEITPKDKIFFQQQFNAATTIQSNTTISYGLGHDMEIGLNVFSLELLPDQRSETNFNPPLFLVNFQKGFEFNEMFSIGIGTQLGQTARLERSDIRLGNFTYAVGVTDAGWGKFYTGGYFASSAYRDKVGDSCGLLLGYDIPIYKDHFSLIGDWVTGSNGIGLAVVGGVFQISESIQISLGAQFPSPRSHNPYGGVLELTYVPGKGAEKSPAKRYPLSYE